MGVAAPSDATAGDNRFLAMFGQVHQHTSGFRISGCRADGDFQRDVPGIFAVHVPAGSVNAAQGFIIALIAKIQKRGKIGVGFQIHISALAPIAAVRATERDIFFLAERDRPVATIPGFDINGHFIDKHNFS